MMKLQHFSVAFKHILILVSVIFIGPYPSSEHFIWPIDNCVLADICNHTWIPECGIENVTTVSGSLHKRIFIDECDMFEYNCDNQRNFVVTNYSLCFGISCLDQGYAALRMGDYKLVNDKRRLVYDPTDKHGHEQHTHPITVLTFPTTTKPNLPKYMLSGRRRYTPYGPYWAQHKPTTLKRETPRKKPTYPKKHKTTPIRVTKGSTMKRSTTVLQKITFRKNGKLFAKLIKGFVTLTTTAKKYVKSVAKEDSDFLE